MSAFMISNEQLSYMLSFCKNKVNDSFTYVINKDLDFPARFDPINLINYGREATISSIERIGRMLIDENWVSLTARYKDKVSAPPQFKFERVLETSPIQVVKFCNCYDYQACEDPQYYESEAKQIISRIRSSAISACVGYDEAKWSI